MAWSCLLLEDLGRFDQALAASAEMRGLPASHYARTKEMAQRVRLFRQAGDAALVPQFENAGSKSGQALDEGVSLSG